MYAFLMGNQNLYIDRTSKFLSGPRLHKLEKIENEVKRKLAKMKDFSGDQVFYSDESDNEMSYSKSMVSKSRTNSPIKSTVTCVMKQTIHSINDFKSPLPPPENKSLTHEKMKEFKNTMKYLDVIVFILLTIGYVLAQIENEDFYLSNLKERSEKAIIINFMINNNITNRTPIAKIENNSNFRSIITFTNITAKELLKFPTPKDVGIDLILSNYSNGLRIALLILTVLTILSRYIEFLRDYIYKEKLEINFSSTNLFFICIIEIVITFIFPFPYLSTYFIVTDLNYSFVMPASSILSSFSFIRFYFLLKLLKHLTKWTSIKAETVCEKYVCKADFQFAFKAFQKENPFSLLFIIFLLTCLCFGLSLRIFELYFWETQNSDTIANTAFQDWSFIWNSMWCIFVAMATVGYGDFHPKTHFGRIVTIIACLIGIYFVSMMMVFMTEKSILTENEYKAFKLITRLKQRKMIRSIQTMMIYQSLLMAKFKKQYNDQNIDEKQFHINYNYQKRNILSEIEEIKAKLRIIKSYDIVPTKEQLFDISERIEIDFTEIKRELDALKLISETIINFTDAQINSFKYLRKNMYATKILFNIIEKNNNFGKSFKLDKALKELFDDKSLSPKKEFTIMKDLLETNPQQFQSPFLSALEKRDGKTDDGDSEIITHHENHDNFNENNFTQEQILENFDFVLTKKSKNILNKTHLEGKKTVAFKIGLEPTKKIDTRIMKKKKVDYKMD